MAEGMLRNTGLRAARGEMDTGTGIRRDAGNPMRQQHVGRGTFVNWYEDLGISTTEPAAVQIRKEEADFASKIAEREGKINEARNRVSAAQSQIDARRKEIEGVEIPELEGAVETSWNQFKSTLTPVRVIGRGDQIEAVYYLPRETADNLINKRGIFATYVGDNVLNVMAKDYRNQELHDPLREAAISLENQYRAQAQEQIAGQLGEAYGTVNEARRKLEESQGEVSRAQGEISSAEGLLQGIKGTHQQQWNEIHSKYQQRSDKMKSILENIMVGGMVGGQQEPDA